MKSKRITFSELCDMMFAHNNEKQQEPLMAVVVFKQESFNTPYSEKSRSYSVTSECKYFKPNMGGNSLFGNCLDGSDNGVRLDWYMYGDNPWQVEYCYLLNEWKFKPVEELWQDMEEAKALFVDCMEAIAMRQGGMSPRESISNGINLLTEMTVGKVQEA